MAGTLEDENLATGMLDQVLNDDDQGICRILLLLNQENYFLHNRVKQKFNSFKFLLKINIFHYQI